MYEIGTPIGGGVVGIGALAYTGFDALGWTAISLAIVVGGLFLLRSRLILSRSNDS